MEPWTNSFHGIERLPALTVHAHDVCFFERHLGSCKPFSTPPPLPLTFEGLSKRLMLLKLCSDVLDVGVPRVCLGPENFQQDYQTFWRLGQALMKPIWPPWSPDGLDGVLKLVLRRPHLSQGSFKVQMSLINPFEALKGFIVFWICPFRLLCTSQVT